MAFDLKTWDGFSKLPKHDLDYMLDVTALNKKMADRKDNPYRWRIGSFHVPKAISGAMFVKASQEASKKFVQAMEKKGWKLESKLQVYGRFPAYDLLSEGILLDMDQYRIRGIFSTIPKPVKIELPEHLVRDDKEEKADLVAAIKATGVKAVPREKRPQK